MLLKNKKNFAESATGIFLKSDHVGKREYQPISENKLLIKYR